MPGPNEGFDLEGDPTDEPLELLLELLLDDFFLPPCPLPPDAFPKDGLSVAVAGLLNVGVARELSVRTFAGRSF